MTRYPLKCIQGDNFPFAIENIDQLIDQFFSDTLINAEYLFLCQQDYLCLNDICMRYMTRNNGGPYALQQYRGLYVVALPTLLEGTSLVGVLELGEQS